MRYFFVALMLAGCGLSPEYKDARHQEDLARYAKGCETLGFKPGTKEHQDCTLRTFESKNAQIGVKVN